MNQQRAVFNPADDFIAMRTFTLNGVNLNPGDVVDRSNLADDRLERMFKNRMVVPKANAGSLLKPATQPGTEQKTNTKAAANTKPAKRAEHRGFGRYYVVDAEDKVLSGPFSKEEAEKRAAE